MKMFNNITKEIITLAVLVKITEIESEIQKYKYYDFDVFSSQTFDQQIADITQVNKRIDECKQSRQKYFEMVFNTKCDFESPSFIIKINKILLLKILINRLEEVVNKVKFKTIHANANGVVKLS